jgi:chromosome segregation ATPase
MDFSTRWEAGRADLSKLLKETKKEGLEELDRFKKYETIFKHGERLDLKAAADDLTSKREEYETILKKGEEDPSAKEQISKKQQEYECAKQQCLSILNSQQMAKRCLGELVDILNKMQERGEALAKEKEQLLTQGAKVDKSLIKRLDKDLNKLNKNIDQIGQKVENYRELLANSTVNVAELLESPSISQELSSRHLSGPCHQVVNLSNG